MNEVHLTTFDIIMITGQVCWDVFLVALFATAFAFVCAVGCAALDRWVA